MNNYRSLNHTKWECQYHVVFIPKYRRKTLYGGLRHYLGDVLRRLASTAGESGGGRASVGGSPTWTIPPKYSGKTSRLAGISRGKCHRGSLGMAP